MATAAASLPAQERLAPSPPAGALLNHLRPMRKNAPRFLLQSALDHGDVVRLRFVAGRTAHLLSSPDGARHVLQDRHKNYDKETNGFRKLRSILGLGLVTSDGDFWLRQRRLIQPAFHKQRLASFGAIMSRDAEQLAEEWDGHAARGSHVSVAGEMMRLTLRIVSETLLNRDLSSEADKVGRALTFAMHHVNRRITKVLDPPEYVPTPGNLRFLAARRTLHAVVGQVIEERRRSREDKGDLLSMLLAARDEQTGEAMTDAQLRDEVLTLFLAGHETTANALAWTFYLLDRNPAIADRLRTEVRRVLGGRTPTLEDLPRLDYARMVIDESMRLYPPAWLVGRRALEDDEIGGYFIPAGTYIFVPPWTVHRNPRVWSDPGRFDPERFSKDRLPSIPRYAHFPFGGGPRQCIGNGFALMEAQIVLATLVQRFRPRLLGDGVVELDPQVTLRPRGGLPMRIERV